MQNGDHMSCQELLHNAAVVVGVLTATVAHADLATTFISTINAEWNGQFRQEQAFDNVPRAVPGVSNAYFTTDVGPAFCTGFNNGMTMPNCGRFTAGWRHGAPTL